MKPILFTGVKSADLKTIEEFIISTKNPDVTLWVKPSDVTTAMARTVIRTGIRLAIHIDEYAEYEKALEDTATHVAMDMLPAGNVTMYLVAPITEDSQSGVKVIHALSNKLPYEAVVCNPIDAAGDAFCTMDRIARLVDNFDKLTAEEWPMDERFELPELVSSLAAKFSIIDIPTMIECGFMHKATEAIAVKVVAINTDADVKGE